MIWRLQAVVSDWPHERDRLLCEEPIGSGRWRVVFDSGCYPSCRRCKIEAFMKKEYDFSKGVRGKYVNMKIAVLYSCSKCGLQRVSVEVVARQEEDVTAWMRDTLQPALGADHQKRSPNCHPDKFTEVLIPLAGAEKIGGPAVQ